MIERDLTDSAVSRSNEILVVIQKYSFTKWISESEE
jgi:hypothetical protein